MKKYFDLLGHEVVDKVTGYKGVATSISFDLFGCVQVVITPKQKEGKERILGEWHDAKRLKVVSRKPVMEVPNFQVPAGTERGANELPKQ